MCCSHCGAAGGADDLKTLVTTSGTEEDEEEEAALGPGGRSWHANISIRCNNQPVYNSETLKFEFLTFNSAAELHGS